MILIKEILLFILIFFQFTLSAQNIKSSTISKKKTVIVSKATMKNIYNEIYHEKQSKKTNENLMEESETLRKKEKENSQI
jgi:tRNA A37 threonylcarbamoyladenosine modification protein TsaB